MTSTIYFILIHMTYLLCKYRYNFVRINPKVFWNVNSNVSYRGKKYNTGIKPSTKSVINTKSA